MSVETGGPSMGSISTGGISSVGGAGGLDGVSFSRAGSISGGIGLAEGSPSIGIASLSIGIDGSISPFTAPAGESAFAQPFTQGSVLSEVIANSSAISLDTSSPPIESSFGMQAMTLGPLERSMSLPSSEKGTNLFTEPAGNLTEGGRAKDTFFTTTDGDSVSEDPSATLADIHSFLNPALSTELPVTSSTEEPPFDTTFSNAGTFLSQEVKPQFDPSHASREDVSAHADNNGYLLPYTAQDEIAFQGLIADIDGNAASEAASTKEASDTFFVATEVLTVIATPEPIVKGHTQEEIEADGRQKTRIRSIIQDLEPEVDAKTAEVLQRIATSLSGKTTESQVLIETEPEAEQETQVSLDSVADQNIAVLTEGEAIEPVDEIEETEDREEDARPKMQKTAIIDEPKVANRIKQATEAAEKAQEIVRARYKQAGVVPGEIVVPGELVTSILVDQGIEKDEEVRSTIIPDEDQDGSIVETLNAIASTEIRESEITSFAKSPVEEHPAVSIGYNPEASDDQINEVVNQKLLKKAVVFQARSVLQNVA